MAAERMTAAELKSWRQALGLSQLAAAEAIGISRRMCCYYESGEKEIPRTVALACVALRQRVEVPPSNRLPI